MKGPNGLFKSKDILVTMLPKISCKHILHKFDEAIKKNRCTTDCDCDGMRTCSTSKWCQGTSRPKCPTVDCKKVTFKTGCKGIPSKAIDTKTGCLKYPCGKEECAPVKPTPTPTKCPNADAIKAMCAKQPAAKTGCKYVTDATKNSTGCL
jgi:hypothetical protein